MTKPLFSEIYQLVKMIPCGKVATYGQVARLVGRPRHVRQVGYALSALGNQQSHELEVPWHRVVNARGEISARAHPDYENYQRVLLEDEGVEFGLKGRIRLACYQWDE